MKFNKIPTIFALILIMFPTIVSAQHVIDDSMNTNYLFTLAGKSGTFDNNVLTLTGAPLVIYFADRPFRIAGHLSLEEFAKLWTSGENPFEKDPPTGQLSIYNDSSVKQDDESGVGHAVLIFEKPKVKDDNISFTVREIDGSIPESFGEASIYIDSLGMHKSPSF